MDALLTIAQVASGMLLALIGLLRSTYDHETKKMKIWGWILLIVAFISLVSATIIKDQKNAAREKKLYWRIDELREKLFTALVPEVMESRKEISKIRAPKPTTKLQILIPKNNTEVPARTYVEGYVLDPKAKVWLIIHPMETSAYWVQPSITVRKDGNWKVAAYLGRSGSIDVGKQFEIMAVANPRVGLKEGDVLDGWPEAQWNSQVIEVVR